MSPQLKLILLYILLASPAIAQESGKEIRLGFACSRGSQQCFPFTDPDYNYSFNGYKLLLNFPLKTGVFCYELQLEPAIYAAKHQLLNKYYIQSVDGNDYLRQREIFIQEKSIIEYALNIGIQVRYRINRMVSITLLGSVGPMYSDTQTERLAKGFAFSDIIQIGAACRIRKVLIELKPGLRHVSNLNIKNPNAGHNATTIDFGISLFM